MISEVNFNFQGEEEGDGDDDNGDDDGFFVPHGYLSDDEGVEDGDDDECDENEENKVVDLLLAVLITYFYTTKIKRYFTVLLLHFFPHRERILKIEEINSLQRLKLGKLQ